MSVATPSIPASTVAVVNSTGQYVDVNIVGGTMTNVSVNGVTVGAGAGNYALPPGGSITMTYTVVPTSWAWTAPLATIYNPGYSTYNTGAEAAGYSPVTSLPYAAHALAGLTGWGVGVSN
jgi:hypothetical protein